MTTTCRAHGRNSSFGQPIARQLGSHAGGSSSYNHDPKKYFSEPCLRAFRAFLAPCCTWIPVLVCYGGIVKGSFRTESFPMENCRRRQSSLVSVLLPHWRLRKGGDSAAGIDSWQRVVKQRYLVSPSRFETPRSVPVTGGRAVAIFSIVRLLARP